MPEYLKENKALRVLLLEDLAGDAKLIERQIAVTNSNYELRIVKDGLTFKQELFNFSPHLIIADYAVPGFDGKEALAFVQENTPSTPFIFVTGTLNDEELAAQTILNGASEFVLKRNISRLPEAIKVVLSQTTEEQVRLAQVEQKLVQYKLVIEQYKKEMHQYRIIMEDFESRKQKLQGRQARSETSNTSPSNQDQASTEIQ